MSYVSLIKEKRTKTPADGLETYQVCASCASFWNMLLMTSVGTPAQEISVIIPVNF